MQPMQNIQEMAGDKQFLRTIVKHHYTLPDDIDAFAFAKALLPNLGSPDSELRDELTYMLLASGLIGKQVLTVPQMEELLLLCIDEDHLFYAIHEPGNDAVFMRSFSNMVIAALLYADSTRAAEAAEEDDSEELHGKHAKDTEDALEQEEAEGLRFSAATIEKTKVALLRYATEERDWRGYVQGKGWAHAMAHLADSLDECAQNTDMGPEDRQKILETVRDLAKAKVPLYNEEDVRLATVAHHMIICKQLQDDILSDWLESCYVERKDDLASWTSLSNVKNFLRSLYFLLIWDNIGMHVADQISRMLKRVDAVYIDGNDTSK